MRTTPFEQPSTIPATKALWSAPMQVWYTAGTAGCGVALALCTGTSHMVSIDDLRPAVKVAIAARKAYLARLEARLQEDEF